MVSGGTGDGAVSIRAALTRDLQRLVFAQRPAQGCLLPHFLSGSSLSPLDAPLLPLCSGPCFITFF